jgi:hypothetical protein
MLAVSKFTDFDGLHFIIRNTIDPVHITHGTPYIHLQI